MAVEDDALGGELQGRRGTRQGCAPRFFVGITTDTGTAPASTSGLGSRVRRTCRDSHRRATCRERCNRALAASVRRATPRGMRLQRSRPARSGSAHVPARARFGRANSACRARPARTAPPARPSRAGEDPARHRHAVGAATAGRPRRASRWRGRLRGAATRCPSSPPTRAICGLLDVPLHEPIERDGVTVRCFPVSPPRFWGTSPPMARALRDAIPRADVVHLHSLYSLPRQGRRADLRACRRPLRHAAARRPRPLPLPAPPPAPSG